MTILDYNRVIRDLNGRRPQELLAALPERFAVQTAGEPVRPASAGEFGMFLAGCWYWLTLRPDLVPKGDPIGRLPITLLARNVIEPQPESLLGRVKRRPAEVPAECDYPCRFHSPLGR